MKDENLDLLDLDDVETEVDDSLPDATPFVAPRPHRPWLLLGVGVAIIVLAVFIIVRVVGSNSSSSMDVDLGAPVVVQERVVDIAPVPAPVPEPVPAAMPAPMPVVQPAPMPVAPAQMPAPRAEPVEPMPVPQQNVRVIEDRKPVEFNPGRETAAPKPIKVPAKKQAKAPEKPKAAPKPAPKTVTKPANGGWYVQFGSYGTREAANAAERKIRSGHAGLFEGKQFVVLAAVLPNGQTTYRLRIAFANSNDANGFCRNAKSDGLDCYVAK